MNLHGTSDSTVDRFSALLDYYPAGFTGNPLNLLLVDDAQPIGDGRDYLRRLDDLSLVDERREYLIDDECPWPFPRTHIGDQPDPWVISQKLFERFEQAGEILTTQGDLASIVDKRVRSSAPDIVALMIVDGLSYYDLPPDVPAEPCLVDGVSITEYGYRRVVGQPTISRRLFALGYHRQIGFTYFGETNELSREIHTTFSESQIVRVSSFDQVLTTLRDTGILRGYVQVMLAGLDQLSHAHLDRPPTDHYVAHILSSYEKLIDCLSTRSKRVLVLLTADHGILWRDVVADGIQQADDLFRDDLRSPRYVRGAVLRPYGRVCRSLGQNFTLFSLPWMTRPFRNNEWGVHGGISAWESIVPLMIQHT